MALQAYIFLDAAGDMTLRKHMAVALASIMMIVKETVNCVSIVHRSASAIADENCELSVFRAGSSG